jgi:hypothetical protein
MRGLGKLLMVAAFVASIGLAAWGLSNWVAGETKTSAVVVEVDPPAAAKGDIIALRGRASLYSGEPREVNQDSVAVDDGEEVNLEQAEQPRFELNADETDGEVFFVYAWIELSNYDQYCKSVALPRMRLEERDGGKVWVNAETGRPLETVRVTLENTCRDPQTGGG